VEIEVFDEPRTFLVGLQSIGLKHVANISLQPDEMVTFISNGSREYDFTAKEWGYYATPSLSKRLKRFGMRAGLTRNIDTNHIFVVVVHDDKMSEWQKYMEDERQSLILWLDEIFHTNPLKGQ